MLTKLNNYLKIMMNNYICAHLCFKNVKLTKLLNLLCIQELFVIYLFEILQCFSQHWQKIDVNIIQK